MYILLISKTNVFGTLGDRHSVGTRQHFSPTPNRQCGINLVAPTNGIWLLLDSRRSYSEYKVQIIRPTVERESKGDTSSHTVRGSQRLLGEPSSALWGKLHTNLRSWASALFNTNDGVRISAFRAFCYLSSLPFILSPPDKLKAGFERLQT